MSAILLSPSLADWDDPAKLAQKLSRELGGWVHNEDCDASSCGEDDCSCPFMPEHLDDKGNLTAEAEAVIDDDAGKEVDMKSHADCTCGLRGAQENAARLVELLEKK